MRLEIFRPPWILWRARDGECEITLELRHATPVVCAVAVLIAHLAGANSVTWALLAATLTMALISVTWAWQMAHHVRARRRLQARWVQVGDVMEEQFTLQQHITPAGPVGRNH